MDQACPLPPLLYAGLHPPYVCGLAAITHRAFAGAALPELLTMRPNSGRIAPGQACVTTAEQASVLLDASYAHAVCFQADAAARLQHAALREQWLFRVAAGPVGRSARPLRLLALVAPGGPMANTPLDFITRFLDVRLDLLFVQPGQPCPPVLPDHDLAFCAASDADLDVLATAEVWLAAWPRPVLNNPARVAGLTRTAVAKGLASVAGCHAPHAQVVDRATLQAAAQTDAPLAAPMLVRPQGSHAGQGLCLVQDATGLAAYLARQPAATFTLTDFVDYRSPDGLYRKLRVALIGGRPALCHLAISDHWMVHYLNAGMAGHAARQAEEAAAFNEFDRGFAQRHEAAFTGLQHLLGLDYAQVDCAEGPDGRLLVFEVDTAAIVHAMDPEAYKQAAMHRVFTAFDNLLQARATEPCPPQIVGHLRPQPPLLGAIAP